MSWHRPRLIAAGVAPVIVALAISVQISQADDHIRAEPEPMRPAVFDWQGPYGGVLFAVKSFKAGIHDLGGTPDKVGGKGRLAGILAGYNVHRNEWVYGVEADAGYGQLRALRGRRRFKADLVGTLRTRMGRTFDNSLLYGTAGIALAGINQSSALMVKGDTATQVSWIVGAGFEHAFARSLTGRLEYLYARNLDGKKGPEIRDMHMIRAGAIYHLPN